MYISATIPSAKHELCNSVIMAVKCFPKVKPVATWRKETSLCMSCQLASDYHRFSLQIFKSNKCWLFVETAFTGCIHSPYGAIYWTAGQRMDPRTISPFIWRPDPLSHTVHLMTYTNWHSTEPTDDPDQNSICLVGRDYYAWHDCRVFRAFCSVCEIDIWVHKPT